MKRHPTGLDRAAKELAWYFGQSASEMGERGSWRESGGYGTGGTENPDPYTDRMLSAVSRARAVRAALMAVGADAHNLLACAYELRQHGRSLRVVAGDLSAVVVRVHAQLSGRPLHTAEELNLDQVRKLLTPARGLLETAIKAFSDAWQVVVTDRQKGRAARLRAFERGMG